MDAIETLTQRVAHLEERLSMSGAPNQDCRTVSEVAAWLGCSPATVRKYEDAGMLIARFPLAKRRFHPHDVEIFMRGRKARKV